MGKIPAQLNPDAVAYIMSRDFICVDDKATFSAAARHFREYEKTTGRSPAVFVFKKTQLAGVLPNSALIIRKPSERVAKYVRPVAMIDHRTSRRDIVHTFRGHPHDKVAVFDGDGSLVGVIYSDDVLAMLQRHHALSLFKFAGVKDEEVVTDSAFAKVRHRYKWLIINLGTAFLAASTVGVFEPTIAKHVLLAVYMPIVAGMGGNAATQTLAVMVRGIALKQITLKTAWKTLWREVRAGMANGIINGLIVAAIVLIVHHDEKLALVLSLAMVINLIVAGFFGTIVPLIMKRLGKDPATSATIFITTATDVLGFLAFLGLGTWLLG